MSGLVEIVVFEREWTRWVTVGANFMGMGFAHQRQFASKNYIVPGYRAALYIVSVILLLAVLVQCRLVTDGQTDRRTDRQTHKDG